MHTSVKSQVQYMSLMYERNQYFKSFKSMYNMNFCHFPFKASI